MPPALTSDAAVAGPTPPDQGSLRPSQRRNVMLGAGIAVFVAMAIFWLLIISGWFKTTSPDRLADQAWVSRAEKRCATMQNRIKALPKAQTAKTPQARVELLTRGSAYVTQLVDQLAADHVATAAEQKLVDQWLADWRVYLGDRAAYARKLPQDPKAQALFTVRHGENVGDAIANFANANDMADCITPPDM